MERKLYSVHAIRLRDMYLSPLVNVFVTRNCRKLAQKLYAVYRPESQKKASCTNRPPCPEGCVREEPCLLRSQAYFGCLGKYS